MKKSLIILFLIFYSTLNAQENKSGGELNYQVLGLVQNGGSYYLNTENGLVKINNNENDHFEKYYQKIYNDSTIVNPNTIINPSSNNLSLSFFNPAIEISQWADKYDTFGNRLYLYDFMEIDGEGRYIFKPGILGLIQKELQNQK